MLVEFVRDLWASAVDLRWYVIGALVVTAICQDVLNAAYLFWNRPVSSAPSIESDLDTDRYPAWDTHIRPFLDVWQMVE